MNTPEQPTPRSAGRVIARNTAFGVGAQIALKIANFAFTILVIRTLGDEHFGQYSVVLAWAGLFSVLGDLGVNQYLAREIARDKNAVNELFWDTVVLRLILSLLASFITIGGAILLTDYPRDILVGIAIFTGTYFFSALMAPLQSILSGNERIDIISVMNVVMQIIFMVLSTIFLLMGFDFVWLVIAGLLNMPAVVILQYFIVKRNNLCPPRLKFNRGLWLSVIRAGLPFAAVQLSLSFAFQVDTIFLSTYTDDQTVGWYNAAYRLIITILTLSNSFNIAVLPTLARQHASDENSVRPWYYSSVRFILIIGLPIAIGGSLLSGNLISIYGTDFLPASLAFAILIWDIPFAMYHTFCGNIAVSIRREGSAARIYMSIGLLNVILNAILIPRFGIAAACFTTVTTDFFGAALYYVVLRKEFGPGLAGRRIMTIFAAAALMGIVVYFVAMINWILAIAVGGVVYLGLIWFLPTILDSERQQIIGLAQRVTRRLRPAMSHNEG